MVGVDDPNRVVARVRGLVRSGNRGGRPAADASAGTTDPAPVDATQAGPALPARLMQAEREVVKAALQLPDVVGKQFDELGEIAFLTALHRQLQLAIAAAGGAAAATAGPSWPAAVAAQLPPDSEARAAVNALAVEPLRSGADTQPRYAEAMVNSLAEQVVAREVAQLKSRLQRLPADSAELGPLFGQLAQLEQRRRELRSRAIGDEA
jgi:DNA primase